MKRLLLILLLLASPAFGQTTNATLNGLANNTAIDLGAITCTDNGGGCNDWTDYSRFVYDRVGHRMLGWGGGHATAFSDSVFAFDLGSSSTLAWTELYAPTPRANMTTPNWDSTNGAWKAGPSGPYPRPTSSHSVGALTHDPVGNQLVTINIKDIGPGGIPPYAGGRYAHYSIGGNTWSFSTTAGPIFPGSPSDEGMPCAYDPLSKLIVCVSSVATVMTYNPATKVKTTRIDGQVNTTLVKNESGTPVGNSLDYNTVMVFNPHDQNIYYFQRGSPITVYRITPNRQNWANTTITRLTTTGAPSSDVEAQGYAYDMVNGVFGTFGTNTFKYFNWRTKVWTVQAVVGSPGSPLPASQTVDYDPVNNVFLWVNSSRHTIAYRFIGNTATADFAKRCSRRGVIRCEGFDDTRSITGQQYVDPFFLYASTDGTTVTIDNSIKSSGAGAARFNVPQGSTGNADIAYNAANDWSVRYGANTVHYLMYRFYLGPGIIVNPPGPGKPGMKLSIYATGGTATGLSNNPNSCEDLSFVVQTIDTWGFFETYNSCQGSYPGHHHQESIGSPGVTDYKLQNQRTAPGCLYTMTQSQNGIDPYPPNGNCFQYRTGQWMSIKQKITIGPRSTNPATIVVGGSTFHLSDFWLNSRMETWTAYDGEDWVKAVDWVFGVTPFEGGLSHDLWAGLASEDHQYGTMWLGLRNANGWPTNTFMLYDEYIVSEQDIAAPGVAGGGGGPGPPILNPVSFKVQ